MTAETIDKLRSLNQDFYKIVATHFSATRDYAWQGWQVLADYLAQQEFVASRILDLGCGNGRFANFAQAAIPYKYYLGVDNNPELLSEAKLKLHENSAISEFLQADILDFPEIVPQSSSKFDLVTLFGVMHHIPGETMQQRIIKYAKGLLNPGGLLVISFWDIHSAEKLLAKITDPVIAGIDPNELAENDYILSWHKGETAYRFCHKYSESEINELAIVNDCVIKFQFKADGANGLGNDYRIFKAK